MTLVERQSRCVILAKVVNKQRASVVSSLIKQARKLPRELYNTNRLLRQYLPKGTDLSVFS